ncbi:Uncharacterised protein [Mycobacteroides abscessus subsp. abscessus]|nr:Uncharacterised protein [Mycobacteroides abscessus subsp. abscessus]
MNCTAALLMATIGVARRRLDAEMPARDSVARRGSGWSNAPLRPTGEPADRRMEEAKWTGLWRKHSNVGCWGRDANGYAR